MGFDLLAILKIIMVDLVLGIDNAVVIAMACVGLSLHQRNKAVAYGTAGAIIARILFLFIGFILIAVPYLKFVAGAYLVYLGISMAFNKEDDHVDTNAKPKTMFGAIVTIMIADIVMSIDNVIAVVSASGASGNINLSEVFDGHALEVIKNIYSVTVHSDGFMYAVIGILISIPIILVASKVFVKLIDKYPMIMVVGAFFITYIGFDMIEKETLVVNFMNTYSLPEKLTAFVLAVIVFLPIVYKKLKR